MAVQLLNSHLYHLFDMRPVKKYTTRTLSFQDLCKTAVLQRSYIKQAAI